MERILVYGQEEMKVLIKIGQEGQDIHIFKKKILFINKLKNNNKNGKNNRPR